MTYLFPMIWCAAVTLTAALAVAGTMQGGWYECWNFPEPDTASFTCPLSLFMTSTGSWSDFWHAGVDTPVGEFALADEFASCCPQGVLDPNDLGRGEVVVPMRSRGSGH